MAAALSREELQRLARLGAETRLKELRQEEAAIRAAFPDLDEGGGRKRGPRNADGARGKRRSRPRMSAARRRAVSERMKRYWAARRKANG